MIMCIARQFGFKYVIGYRDDTQCNYSSRVPIRSSLNMCDLSETLEFILLNNYVLIST